MIKDYFAHFDILNSDVTITVGAAGAPEVREVPSCEKWRVTLADTGQEAMTGARVKRVERYIDTDVFMLTYGDGVADVDVRELLEFHREHGKLGTITGVAPLSRFGELCVEGNRVVSFCEKPHAADTWINGGFFVFSRGFLDYLTDEDSCILETAPLENLAQDGQLMVYKHQGFWHCMDTMRDVNSLSALWRGGKAPWRTWP
jgi:glucose-1-phosphate cytidylyltransferase